MEANEDAQRIRMGLRRYFGSYDAGGRPLLRQWSVGHWMRVFGCETTNKLLIWSFVGTNERNHHMAIQLAFDFWGSTSPEAQAASESDRLQNIQFEVIARMIADRRAPVWVISRKIAGEMSTTIKQAKIPVKPFQHRGPQVDLNNRMKGLRELQKTLVEAERLSKEEVLDLDGPKFRFVRAEVVRLFEQALKDAGADRFQVESIMVRVDNLMKANDANMRRDLDLIGANEMRADDMRVLPPVLHGAGWLAVSQQQSA